MITVIAINNKNITMTDKKTYYLYVKVDQIYVIIYGDISSTNPHVHVLANYSTKPVTDSY